MSTAFSDHFAGVATHYASHRPSYPDALFSWLASQLAGRRLAWDCATGSGQAAVALADHFDEVLATDASSSQIEAAKPWPGVVYRVAPADDSGLAPQSVDLVTVAQALHWFDLERFYAEVRRVLKPGGLLAVWTYGVFRLEGGDAGQLQELLNRFYWQTVGPYWPAERRHVENGYAKLHFPFGELATPSFAMQVYWSLDDLAGYLRSWSATSRYRELVGVDPVAELTGLLAPLWGAAPRQVSWPLSLKVGRLVR